MVSPCLVVVAEGELHEVRKLADCIRDFTLDAETAEVDAGDTAVVVYLDSWLVSPEVRVPVEIPVGSLRPGLAFIGPVRAVKGKPYFAEGVIVPHISVRHHEGDRDIGFGEFVVGHFNDSRLVFEAIGEVLVLEKEVVGIIETVRQYLVVSGRSIDYGIGLA